MPSDTFLDNDNQLDDIHILRGRRIILSSSAPTHPSGFVHKLKTKNNLRDFIVTTVLVVLFFSSKWTTGTVHGFEMYSQKMK